MELTEEDVDNWSKEYEQEKPKPKAEILKGLMAAHTNFTRRLVDNGHLVVTGTSTKEVL